MELFLVWALLITALIECIMFLVVISELRRIDARLRVIASLTRDTRSHQGSIGTRRVTGPAPIIDRPKQQGPRHEVPATGHMARGLKFERRGGEYERNRDAEGD